MNRKEIHFVIEPEGGITSTIKGIKGSHCSTVAAEFKGLGQVTEEKPTHEFYASDNSHRMLLDLERKGGQPR